MTAIFGQFVQEMLVKYAQNPQGAWKSKDAAIYLVTSLVAKGQTQKEGVTKTNELVNVLDFYQTHILPELSNPEGITSILCIYIEENSKKIVINCI